MKNFLKLPYYLFLNPIFVLYAYVSFDNSRLDDSDIKGYEWLDEYWEQEDNRQLFLGESNNLELELVSFPEAVKLRENFKTVLIEKGALSSALKEIEIPIAIMTFVFSVFIAIDIDCRKSFYTGFQGKKIPTILQFCMETFRIGLISNNECISKFFFSADYYSFCSDASLSYSLFDWETLKKKYNFDPIFTWFDLLADHFNKSKQPYMEYVELSSISFYTNKNFLCGLTVKNNEIIVKENHYFRELSRDKKDTYSLLAGVLNFECLGETEQLTYTCEDGLKSTFDEQKTITKLINFIVNDCKNYLLNNSSL